MLLILNLNCFLSFVEGQVCNSRCIICIKAVWSDFFRMSDVRGLIFFMFLVFFLLFAGHHTIYIGVHVPKSYRRRRRHRRRATHKDRKEKLTENVSDKSDAENNDEASNSILKPLSKFWWTPCQGWLAHMSVSAERLLCFSEKKAPLTHRDLREVAESS